MATQKTSKRQARWANATAYIMEALNEMLEMMPMPLETPYHHTRRLRGFPDYPYWHYHHTVKRLAARGFLEKVRREGREFIQLTNEGRLELLCRKMQTPHKQTWDGKWRVAIFDIPEVAHATRDEMRTFLKKIGFRQLQQSVYITPHALSKESVDYLTNSGLQKYIRFLRVDQCDDDTRIKKKFGMR